MIPVVTPEEMKAVDEAAPEPTEVLVHRAGAGVARAALEMMGGSYGRRVVVVAGKGNNETPPPASSDAVPASRSWRRPTRRPACRPPTW